MIIDPLTEAVWKATQGKPGWRPVVFQATYTFCDDETLTIPVVIWGHPPWWGLNRWSGKAVAWWCELFAWWRRLVVFGTPAEKAAACVMAAMAAKWWVGA